MKRFALCFKLQPGAKAEYVRRHRHIWPQMTKLLNEAGRKNLSIWNHGDWMFMYYETDDEEKMNRLLENSEVRRQWRREMAQFIAIDEATGVREWPMEMVFLHAGSPVPAE